VIILTVFYVYFDVSYINVLIDGMNKNENEMKNRVARRIFRLKRDEVL
jgi:hypothetical protein